MRVEFIELLRCPAPHQAAPLITVANERRGDDIIDATLGCVVCGAEYPLRDGCVMLSPLSTTSMERMRSQVASDARFDSASRTGHDDSDEALRLAALLGLPDVTTRALLCGETARLAQAIESLTGARCLALNPPGARAATLRPIDCA